MAAENVPTEKQVEVSDCGCAAPPGTVRVGWICKDDLAELLEEGSAVVYGERQEFRLLPDVEQVEIFLRAGNASASTAAPEGYQAVSVKALVQLAWLLDTEWQADKLPEVMERARAKLRAMRAIGGGGGGEMPCA
ncbi:hypothetical protein [Ramlibacter sp.]|uniref:hypothetical protein n=1 Tax=Ramlibacter sp. TaxID=1917967 RepID=UPI003D0AA712